MAIAIGLAVAEEVNVLALRLRGPGLRARGSGSCWNASRRLSWPFDDSEIGDLFEEGIVAGSGLARFFRGNLGDVADVPEDGAPADASGARAGPGATAGSSAITRTSVKKRSTGGYSEPSSRIALTYSPLATAAEIRRPSLVQLLRQLSFGRLLQGRARYPPSSMSESSTPLVMFFTRLKSPASAWNSGDDRDLRQRLDALQRGLRVSPRVLAGQPGHHPDFVDFEAAVLQEVLLALPEELADWQRSQPALPFSAAWGLYVLNQ